MSVWAIQILNGLSYGMLLFLLAAGLTLTFGLLRIVSLVHGSFYLLGGYVGLMVVVATENFWLGLLAGAVSMGVLGLVVQQGLLRRYARSELQMVLLTFGLLFLFGDLALAYFGGNPQTIPAPAPFGGSIPLLDARFPVYRLFLVAVGIVVAGFLWWLHERTKLGTIVRAAVEDPETAAGLGVNVPLVMAGVYALGALLAGMAGVVGGPIIGVYPGADLDTMFYAIVVVVLGGLGSLRGAFVAALLIGFVDTAGKALFPELALFAIFAPMAIVLVIRPSGLLGRA